MTVTILSFSEFVKQFNWNSFSYDLEKYSPDALKQSSDLFTQDQYSFLMQSCSTMFLAILRSYHEWLAEQLRTSHPGE